MMIEDYKPCRSTPYRERALSIDLLGTLTASSCCSSTSEKRLESWLDDSGLDSKRIIHECATTVLVCVTGGLVPSCYFISPRLEMSTKPIRLHLCLVR